MTRARWLGLLLIVAGFLILIVAPQAQSCVTDFHATICEAAGMIALKVVGVALVAIAAMVLARRGAPTKG
ncbi:MAG: hypothetical protein ACXWL8_00110 [Candidatus Limnocylindria bacterium]